MKILIIDDEHNIRLLLKEIFMMRGWEADEAANGQIGYELVQDRSYDLILLDRRMPVLSGEETLKKIRQLTDIPVILISAFQTDEEMKRIIEIGANDILMKPFTIDEVMNIAEKYE